MLTKMQVPAKVLWIQTSNIDTHNKGMHIDGLVNNWVMVTDWLLL